MSISFRDGDVAAIFAHAKKMGLAVTVSINAIAGVGFVDENDQIIVSDGQRGEVVGGVHTVTVQTSAFPSIREGMPIVVDSVSYTVRQKLKEGDAALTKILLGSA